MMYNWLGQLARLVHWLAIGMVIYFTYSVTTAASATPNHVRTCFAAGRAGVQVGLPSDYQTLTLHSLRRFR